LGRARYYRTDTAIVDPVIFLPNASFHNTFRILDPIVKMKTAFPASGMFGVMNASNGIAVLGQIPESILI